ncbi:unnamed protein product [Penicillium salamii]|uniref:Multiprotein-bridging factor 1 n=1 Tax=Penicillium salamii TaxID=1612424 RepID=A0A9W4J616_9EURO|nr:unnamed protein product [Penicillium salamii]
MSDWDTTTMIGNRRTGAGAPQHQQTLRGNSAINAAKRTGGVSAEKKYTTGNLAAKAGQPEGQLMTKVDRSDDIVKPKYIESHIVENVKRARAAKNMSQKQVAAAASIPVGVYAEIENGKAMAKDANPALNQLQKVLGYGLRKKQAPGGK